MTALTLLIGLIAFGALIGAMSAGVCIFMKVNNIKLRYVVYRKLTLFCRT